MTELKSGELIGAEEPLPVIEAVEQTPASLLSQALAKGVDTDTLQKFMDLQERFEAGEARKAYAADMAKCQAKMPVIASDASNSQTSSLYATLGKINSMIAPVYTRYGFSMSFDEQPLENDEIRTRARVIHKMGHVEEFTYDLPLDLSGIKGNTNKTAIHAKGSTTTYARRYLTMMIFNLAVGDDLDGNLPGGVATDDEQAMKLEALVIDWQINGDAILREFGVQSWDKLPASKYDKAAARIKQIGEARQR